MLLPRRHYKSAMYLYMLDMRQSTYGVIAHPRRPIFYQWLKRVTYEEVVGESSLKGKDAVANQMKANNYL